MFEARGLFYMMIVNILGWEVIKLNKQTSDQNGYVVRPNVSLQHEKVETHFAVLSMT